MQDRQIVGEDGLRAFLAEELDIYEPHVTDAITALRGEPRSHSIRHVLLTPARIKKVWG
jgi:hypothetical protein